MREMHLKEQYTPGTKPSKPGYYYLPLPVAWVREHGLGVGDRIDVWYDPPPHPRVLITPHARPQFPEAGLVHVRTLKVLQHGLRGHVITCPAKIVNALWITEDTALSYEVDERADLIVEKTA